MANSSVQEQKPTAIHFNYNVVNICIHRSRTHGNPFVQKDAISGGFVFCGSVDDFDSAIHKFSR